MGAKDFQLMVANESTYNTPVTVTRAFEWDSGDIEDDFRRTEGEPLRRGSAYPRNDRFTPYYGGASGTLTFEVLTKGFGFWLPHMLGAVATTGPAETSVYTHTGTEGSLLGDMFTLQVNKPFHPAGTDQPLTYAGGKVTEWTLSNSAEDNLMLELGMDFASVSTATGLATASYPSTEENLTWAGGSVTIGGSSVDVTEISIKGSNGYNVDRRQIRGNTAKKEPISGKRELTFSIKCDFESLAQRTRAVSTTRAGALAAIVATWTGPTLLGTTIYPSYQVTIPAARFDEWKAPIEDWDGIEQELTGIGTYDGTNSPVTIVYKSADTTA